MQIHYLYQPPPPPLAVIIRNLGAMKKCSQQANKWHVVVYIRLTLLVTQICASWQENMTITLSLHVAKVI